MPPRLLDGVADALDDLVRPLFSELGVQQQHDFVVVHRPEFSPSHGLNRPHLTSAASGDGATGVARSGGSVASPHDFESHLEAPARARGRRPRPPRTAAPPAARRRASVAGRRAARRSSPTAQGDRSRAATPEPETASTSGAPTRTRGPATRSKSYAENRDVGALRARRSVRPRSGARTSSSTGTPRATQRRLSALHGAGSARRPREARLPVVESPGPDRFDDDLREGRSQTRDGADRAARRDLHRSALPRRRRRRARRGDTAATFSNGASLTFIPATFVDGVAQALDDRRWDRVAGRPLELVDIERESGRTPRGSGEVARAAPARRGGSTAARSPRRLRRPVRLRALRARPWRRSSARRNGRSPAAGRRQRARAPPSRSATERFIPSPVVPSSRIAVDAALREKCDVRLERRQVDRRSAVAHRRQCCCERSRHRLLSAR